MTSLHTCHSGCSVEDSGDRGNGGDGWRGVYTHRSPRPPSWLVVWSSPPKITRLYPSGGGGRGRKHAGRWAVAPPSPQRKHGVGERGRGNFRKRHYEGVAEKCTGRRTVDGGARTQQQQQQYLDSPSVRRQQQKAGLHIFSPLGTILLLPLLDSRSPLTETPSFHTLGKRVLQKLGTRGGGNLTALECTLVYRRK